ncbi:MAG: hypothetical protein JEZ03_07895 [Bacteroidales bacterium]|nr:hypothetical protein [Bacteroidales bacterium]
MKKVLFILSIMLITTVSAFSQYHTAIGLRGGSHFSGITVRHLPGEHLAYEGILSLRYHGGAMATLLLEHQSNTTWGVDGLNWYWGYGAHAGTWDNSDSRLYNGDFALGADGILGIEYIVPEIPIVVSLDYHPSINILGPGFFHNGTAFSIRYILK